LVTPTLSAALALIDTVPLTFAEAAGEDMETVGGESSEITTTLEKELSMPDELYALTAKL
jgi:hypothetical protein